MEMKHYTLIGLILCIVLIGTLIGIYLSNQTKQTTQNENYEEEVVGKVSVSTDKLEYSPKEEVNIFVHNGLEREIGLESSFSPAFGSFSLWKKGINGEWKIEYVSIPEPIPRPKPETRDWKIVLKPQDKFYHAWDQKVIDENGDRIYVQSGTMLRIGLQWYYPSTDDGDISYSNEFLIK